MLHENARFEAAAFARCAVLFTWAIIIATSRIEILAVMPDALFDPPGVLNVLPKGVWHWLRRSEALSMLRIALSVTLACLAIGWIRNNVVAIVAIIGIIIFDGMTQAYGGFVDHSRFALLYSALMTALPGGERSRFRRGPAAAEPRSYSAELRAIAFLVAILYALTGLERIIVGETQIFFNDTLPINIVLRTFESSDYSWTLGYEVVGSELGRLLVKCGFFVATVCEVASPLAVFDSGIRRVWLAVIIPFHCATLFLMNILFWENLVVIIVFFTDMPTGFQERCQFSGRSMFGQFRNCSR